jgi:dihydropteroate synthase
MKGKPINMQENPKYLNIINDINSYFEKKIKILEAGGFNKIILDPGLGFGKTLEHNYQIIQNIQNIHSLKYPILIGASRKSMIYNLLKTNADQALNGTTVINTMSLLKGAKFLRVHDVKEAIECVKIIEFSKKIIK